MTKKDFLRMYNAIRTEDDKTLLVKKTPAGEDLRREMVEDDLAKQTIKPCRMAKEETLRIDSPGHLKDLEATFGEALGHNFELTFWSRTLKDYFLLTAPWQGELHRLLSVKEVVGESLYDIQKDSTSYQAAHYPLLWRVMRLDDYVHFTKQGYVDFKNRGTSTS